jgi:hypothetical protein
MSMRKHVLLAVLMLAGCGGHKHADTTPTDDTDTTPPTTTSGDPGVMISPEKMDEVQRDLQRKGMIVSQCLASAMDSGEVKKNTHGQITLEIVIESGRATSVKVMRTNIDVKSVQDCVIGHVNDIAFPQMVKRYETSYTYAMEAN